MHLISAFAAKLFGVLMHTCNPTIETTHVKLHCLISKMLWNIITNLNKRVGEGIGLESLPKFVKGAKHVGNSKVISQC
jgi:hypothetical protein